MLWHIDMPPGHVCIKPEGAGRQMLPVAPTCTHILASASEALSWVAPSTNAVQVLLHLPITTAGGGGG